jgi:hypothetical protein
MAFATTFPKWLAGSNGAQLIDGNEFDESHVSLHTTSPGP